MRSAEVFVLTFVEILSLRYPEVPTDAAEADLRNRYSCHPKEYLREPIFWTAMHIWLTKGKEANKAKSE